MALMRQNLEMLMNQAAGMGQAPGIAGMAPPLAAPSAANAAVTAPLASKLDKLSETFREEEKKMEERVVALETENSAMKQQLTDEAGQITQLRGELRKKASAQPVPAVSQAAVAKATKIKTGLKVKQTPKYATAPWEATFKVHLDGKSKGKQDSFTIRVHPEWAPEGAKRFQDIVQAGILKDTRFFRVVPGFMVQFGIPGVPKVAAKWEHMKIHDDPVTEHNSRGMVTFATSGPNTRTTQMFINFGNNEFLDKQGFAPFGEVIDDGMDVVDKIQSKYKERPNQAKIQHHGTKYLAKHFPDLSFVDHVESTLKFSPPKEGAFLQDSATPMSAMDEDAPMDAEDLGKKVYRFGGIATFFHHKVKTDQ